MIKKAELSDSSSNEVNININGPFPYKYIRYNPPSTDGKNITEIKISGHTFL